jgi:hypothetical protein
MSGRYRGGATGTKWTTERGRPKPMRMCLICIDFDKGKLTTQEARRAIGEMKAKLDTKHLAEVETKVAQAEAQATKPP